MIHAVVPRTRKQLDWKELIKSKEDYEKWVASGMYWVYFEEVNEEIRKFVFEEEDDE